jgi:hypothetical protein
LETGRFYVVRTEELSLTTTAVDSSVRVCEDRASASEAEEYPLLEAVAREHLVTTQQAGKGLAGDVVICGD